MPDERPADESPTEKLTETSAETSAAPLRVVLHSLEEQVDRRVDKVAEAKPAREESTAELIKLEEALESAQDKAKQLVTLRLKLGDRPGEPREEDRSAEDRPAGDAGRAAGQESAEPEKSPDSEGGA